MEKLGLSEYTQRFAENGIDLRYLTDEDLEKIGVLLGHRRKILAAIADLVGWPHLLAVDCDTANHVFLD